MRKILKMKIMLMNVLILGTQIIMKSNHLDTGNEDNVDIGNTTDNEITDDRQPR